MNICKYYAKVSVTGRYLMVHKARIINRYRAMKLVYGRTYG